MKPLSVGDRIIVVRSRVKELLGAYGVIAEGEELREVVTASGGTKRLHCYVVDLPHHDIRKYGANLRRFGFSRRCLFKITPDADVLEELRGEELTA